LSHAHFLNHPWHQLKFLSVSPLAPCAETTLAGVRGMAPVPGGGILIQVDSCSFLYLGPGKGEQTLARQVDEAVAAAGRGDRDRFATITGAFSEWTADPRQAYERRILGAIANGGLGTLNQDSQDLVGGFAQDRKGLAIRAQFALDAIAALAPRLPDVQAEPQDDKGAAGPAGGNHPGAAQASSPASNSAGHAVATGAPAQSGDADDPESPLMALAESELEQVD
jgi:hypothetical protein